MLRRNDGSNVPMAPPPTIGGAIGPNSHLDRGAGASSGLMPRNFSAPAVSNIVSLVTMETTVS